MAFIRVAEALGLATTVVATQALASAGALMVVTSAGATLVVTSAASRAVAAISEAIAAAMWEGVSAEEAMPVAEEAMPVAEEAMQVAEEDTAAEAGAIANSGLIFVSNKRPSSK